MFFEHRLTFFQSKKELDADENITRAEFMWSKLPLFLKEYRIAERKFCLMKFPQNGSRIMGIPSGPDHYRQYTSSGVFSDELVYQDRVDEVLGAVGPTLVGGGRFTGVSSAGPSYFAQLIRDEI